MRWPAEAALRNVAQLLNARTPATLPQQAFERDLAAELGRFLARPATARPLPTPSAEPPLGAPIGMGEWGHEGCGW